MTPRQNQRTEADRAATAAATPAPSPLRVRGPAPSGLVHHRYLPRTRAEVEEHYVAAREAWSAAMKAANSGRAADLAALAIAQEAYEAAVAERERWESGARVAIPVEPETPHPDLGAVIGQELAWRRVRSVVGKPGGLLGRLGRRLRGDGR